MTDPTTAVPLRSLVLVPALITLGVTLLRLTGELLHWPSTFFSRAAGGAGAIVGIVWLVPIFGVYFALRLNRMGERPAGWGRVVGISLLAVLLMPATIFLAVRTAPPGPARVVVFGAGSVVALLVGWRAWPALARTLFTYGLAARVPVALIMLVAILANWGTHYELGPPGFPEMAALPRWFFIGLVPQLTAWIAFTVVFGSLFGGIAALLAGRRSPEVPAGALAAR